MPEDIKPNPALKALEVMVGAWGLKGLCSGSGEQREVGNQWINKIWE